MILYLDASSLVKLFVSEEGSDEVWWLVAEASLVAATSVLAYPEARSAFAPAARAGGDRPRGRAPQSRPQARGR